jgi:hypothetical protein
MIAVLPVPGMSDQKAEHEDGGILLSGAVPAVLIISLPAIRGV